MEYKRGFVCMALAGLLSLTAGCTMRPAVVSEAPAAAVPVATAAPAVPESTPEAARYTVEFRVGQALLGSETVEEGAVPQGTYAPEGVRLLGWKDAAGNAVDPAAVPVTGNAVYYAVTRPILKSGDLLRGDQQGFLRPQEAITAGDAAGAVRVLTDDGSVNELLSVWEQTPETPLAAEQLKAALELLFTPEEMEPVLAQASLSESAAVTRGQFAFCLARLLDLPPRDDRYYPDCSPRHPFYPELTAVAAEGTLDRDALTKKTLDGFLWFDGFLYYLDEEGYFLSDETRDGLYYNAGGRFTSGNEELDGYVAQTIKMYMVPGGNRLDQLKAMYNHVKNDLNYLVRNYYASGATGWEIDEALTMYRTGRGNCYCYAGTFWSLARGLGYNAVVYSGTMGVENQPHAWTEIFLDDKIYICDPEIEMNYWYLAAVTGNTSMYTNNFMMLRENSLGWNYQSAGRK